MPLELMFKCCSVMRMRWMRYVTQYGEDNQIMPIDNIEVPNCVHEAFEQFDEAIKEFDMTFLIGENILKPIFEDIKYFASLKLCSEEFICKFEEEIIQFLNELEFYSLKGKNLKGKQLDIYVHHVYSTGSMALVEGVDRKVAYLKTYGTNYFSTEDSVICEAQAGWIQNIKKNSTYITQSGEVVRSNFLRNQRKLLSQFVEESYALLR